MSAYGKGIWSLVCMIQAVSLSCLADPATRMANLQRVLHEIDEETKSMQSLNGEFHLKLPKPDETQHTSIAARAEFESIANSEVQGGNDGLTRSQTLVGDSEVQVGSLEKKDGSKDEVASHPGRRPLPHQIVSVAVTQWPDTRISPPAPIPTRILPQTSKEGPDLGSLTRDTNDAMYPERDLSRGKKHLEAKKFPISVNLGLHAKVNELRLAIDSSNATISHYRHDDKNGDLQGIPTGSLTLVTSDSTFVDPEKSSSLPNAEMNRQGHDGRTAAVKVMCICCIIVIILVIVYLSQIAREVLYSMFGADDFWEVGDERPQPNVYRAIAILRPRDIGSLRFCYFVGQGCACAIMQLYIPVTLLHQNLMTFEIAGLKHYSSMSLLRWSDTIFQTIALFNVAAIFTFKSTTSLVVENEDDLTLLGMRKVRSTDPDKNDILIQYVQDLSHESPPKRIAAASMLMSAATPGDCILTSSDLEEGKSVNILDALCARLDSVDHHDEHGNAVSQSVEKDQMAKSAVCRALGVLAGPEDTNVVDALSRKTKVSSKRNTSMFEDLKFCIRRLKSKFWRSKAYDNFAEEVDRALEMVEQDFKAPIDEMSSVLWDAWSKLWVAVSLLSSVVVAIFLQVVIFIKVMVHMASLQEMTMMVMALFFVNDLDTKAIKHQPFLRKVYWIHCYQRTKKRQSQPEWVKNFAVYTGVPLLNIILYVGLVMMFSVTWKNRYTGQIVGQSFKLL